MKKVVRKFTDFSEAESEEIKYWQSISPEKRIEFLEKINSRYYEIKNRSKQRLQRVYSIIKQA